MTVRRFLVRAAVVIVVLCGGLVGWAVWHAERTEHPVGFRVVKAAQPGGHPLTVAVWYPTSASPRPTTLLGATLLDVAWNGPVKGERLPLVVISHGNEGGPGSHADLAMALADAGYVVAAPIHPGDNIIETGGIGKAGFWSGRNAQLRLTIDHMLQGWDARRQIDPARIGAFGFSAGGFTVLTAVGGQPDMAMIAEYCVKKPEFVCKILAHYRSPLLQPGGAASEAGFQKDPRIAAAVVAAPGLGFTLAQPDRLTAVRVPVQLWGAGKDDRAPPATNIEPIRTALPLAPELHMVPGAGHLSFLAPCRLLSPPGPCTDPEGFDRSELHRSMNRAVIDFFDRNLGGNR